MTPDDLKTLIEIVQGAVTSVGILAAGVWSFYVFVLGRSFSPNIRIETKLKKMIRLQHYKSAIVTITIKNIGKSRVQKENCWLATCPLESSSEPAVPILSRIDSPLEFGLSESKLYPIFNEHTWFEPDEETTEDVLLALGETKVFKVGVVFVGQKKKWASSTILEMI